MNTKSGAIKGLRRRAYGTVMTVSVVAIASGCTTTRWVPLTQAPPKGDRVRLKVESPSDSVTASTREMTLYYPRMEGDSVLVGTQLPGVTPQERVRAEGALVGVRHISGPRTMLLVAGIAGGVAILIEALVALHHALDLNLGFSVAG